MEEEEEEEDEHHGGESYIVAQKGAQFVPSSLAELQRVCDEGAGGMLYPRRLCVAIVKQAGSVAGALLYLLLGGVGVPTHNLTRPRLPHRHAGYRGEEAYGEGVTRQWVGQLGRELLCFCSKEADRPTKFSVAIPMPSSAKDDVPQLKLENAATGAAWPDLVLIRGQEVEFICQCCRVAHSQPSLCGERKT